jgi:hypothetical protein
MPRVPVDADELRIKLPAAIHYRSQRMISVLCINIGSVYSGESEWLFRRGYGSIEVRIPVEEWRRPIKFNRQNLAIGKARGIRLVMARGRKIPNLTAQRNYSKKTINRSPATSILNVLIGPVGGP